MHTISLPQQIILYGSTFLALEKKVVSVESILETIIELELSNQTLIAYRSICIHSETTFEQHKNFLNRAPPDEYLAIYLLSNLDPAPLKITHKKLYRVSMALINNFDFSVKLWLICDRLEGLAHVNITNINLVIASRSDQLFSRSSQKVFDVLFLASDRLDQIKFPSQLEYASRFEALTFNAPDYWDLVARSLYTEFLRNLIVKRRFEKLRLPNLLELTKYIPDLVPEWITSLSPGLFQIYYSNPIQKAYVLGFPIHQMVPSEDELDVALRRLHELGPEAYMKLIHDFQNSETVNQKLTPFSPDRIRTNEKCILQEPIFDYGSFDRIDYTIGKHIYTFTRPTFPSILNTQINHYTGLKIPFEIITEIRKRVRIAQLNSLPEPGTIKELIENAMEENDDSDTELEHLLFV